MPINLPPYSEMIHPGPPILLTASAPYSAVNSTEEENRQK